MSDPFAATHRTLAAPSLPIGRAVVAGLLLMAWGGWMAMGEVGVRITSPNGRVEVAGQALPLQVEGEGRVVVNHLRVGARVAQGDVLLRLEDTVEAARCATERATLAGLEAEFVELARRRSADERAAPALRRSGAAAVSRAERALDEARSAEGLAVEHAARVRTLLEAAAAPQWEWQEADAAATQARARRMAAEAEVGRLGGDVSRAGAEGEGRSAALRQAQEALTAQIIAARARLAGAEAERDRRTLKSPQAGRIGEAPPLSPGAVVAAGAWVATLLPDGDPWVVALFPARELGRIRPGQGAALRADAYDWVRYGVVPLTVAEVAGETRDGQLRVGLVPAGPTPFPLSHGLSGAVEIEAERVAPLELLLRAAGALARPAVGGAR